MYLKRNLKYTLKNLIKKYIYIIKETKEIKILIFFIFNILESNLKFI